MSFVSIKERISSYEEIANYKLLHKLPLIIRINGRSFNKITSLLDKPYCDKFEDCMAMTMLQLCLEIEGAIFGYSYNDEIIIVARNDQSNETLPWYDNRIQKIVSAVASIATLKFNNFAAAHDLSLTGDPLFLCSVYAVPSITEAINVLISKQHQNFQLSVQHACFYELLKTHNKNYIKELLIGLAMDDKINLLFQECNINFQDYPVSFKRGVACYRAPKMVNEVIRNKWIINKELPIFTEDYGFLTNIIKQGADILRKEDI